MNLALYKIHYEFEHLIEETCLEVLNCGPTVNIAHFNWVKCIVMKSIDKAVTSDQTKINMSSMFREDVVEGDCLISVFTSTFMCFLAGQVY